MFEKEELIYDDYQLYMTQCILIIDHLNKGGINTTIQDICRLVVKTCPKLVKQI